MLKIIDFFRSFFTIKNSDPLPLDDYIEKFSVDTDALILKFENNEGLKFVGGELIVENKDLNVLLLKLCLYFTNSEDSILLKETIKKLDKKNINSSDIADLIENKIIKFEVTHPDQSKESNL